MHRRNFIRLAGGGVALATVAGIGGCSSAYPPDAVAAWAGPPEQADLRRWALGYAILAPNSHNRQPWIADLREPDAITLYAMFRNLVPVIIGNIVGGSVLVALVYYVIYIRPARLGK